MRDGHISEDAPRGPTHHHAFSTYPVRMRQGVVLPGRRLEAGLQYELDADLADDLCLRGFAMPMPLLDSERPAREGYPLWRELFHSLVIYYLRHHGGAFRWGRLEEPRYVTLLTGEEYEALGERRAAAVLGRRRRNR